MKSFSETCISGIRRKIPFIIHLFSPLAAFPSPRPRPMAAPRRRAGLQRSLNGSAREAKISLPRPLPTLLPRMLRGSYGDPTGLRRRIGRCYPVSRGASEPRWKRNLEYRMRFCASMHIFMHMCPKTHSIF